MTSGPERSAEGALRSCGVESAATVGSNLLADWVGPLWSGERVRAALGLPDREALAVLRRDRRVLGVPISDGEVVYPAWQFQQHGATWVVCPTLAAVLTIIGGHDGWAVAVLLNTPAPQFGKIPASMVPNS